MSLARVSALGGYKSQKPPIGLFYVTNEIFPNTTVQFDVSNPPSQDSTPQFAYLGIDASAFSQPEVSGTTYSKSRSVSINSSTAYYNGVWSVMCSTCGNSVTSNTGSNETKCFKYDNSDDTHRWAFKKNSQDCYVNGTGAVNSVFYSVSNYSSGGSSLVAKGEWWMLKAPRALRLTALRQLTRVSFVSRAAAQIMVLCSSDLGSTWTKYCDNVTMPSQDDSGAITLTNTLGTFHQVYRLVILQTLGSNLLNIRGFFLTCDVQTN